MLNSDHDKLFSKLLSCRERYNLSKQGDTSFRVLYYAGATGSVPFVWESEPGTPKHKFSDRPLPPLTPPPQFHSSPRGTPTKHCRSSSKINLNSIFARVSSRKLVVDGSPVFSPLPAFSSLPTTPFHAGKSRRKGRSRSAVHFGVDEDDPTAVDSPISTLCFGPRNGSPTRKLKGYSYPIKSVKKVVMLIVGHRLF